MMKDLLAKYDVQLRATHLTRRFLIGKPVLLPINGVAFKNDISKSQGGWTLYLHIPYCESLCTSVVAIRSSRKIIRKNLLTSK